MPTLPQNVLFALDRLHENGFEAYLVGGCVRDSLLGLPTSDFDITTSALPDEIKSAFSDCRLIDTGIRHGTVTVLVNGQPLEITSFRVDGAYSDGRHPDRVSFTRNLFEDAKRRDLTVNALYYSPQKGLIDPFGGQQDLKNGLLRTVGEPHDRFQEDALRLLRAVRFASVYGFSIEDKTERALLDCRELLKNVSAERIQKELLKLLGGKDVRRILTSYTELLGVILPELLPLKGFDQRNKYHVHDILTHTAVVIDSVKKKPSLLLAALFHDIGKPACFTLDKKGFGHFYGHAEVSVSIAEQRIKSLRIREDVKKDALTLIRYHDVRFPAERKTVRKWMARLSPALFFDLVDLKKGDLLGQSPAYIGEMAILEEMETLANDILKEGECLSLSTLAIDGNDLLALGFSEGKAVGSTLKKLLSLVLDGSLPNEKDALLAESRRMLLR